uniref:Immunoglobulin V-set domain-containing protein n=1 Tax=Callorhinchus milii TaxID=7868 RepID=A0A4W3JJ10_CALMI
MQGLLLLLIIPNCSNLLHPHEGSCVAKEAELRYPKGSFCLCPQSENWFFSDTLRATQSVTGVVGRAITINCHYQKQWYRNNKKYWCWGYYRDSCQVVIDTKANNGRRGRFSITDNRDGIFTVTMENLTTGDVTKERSKRVCCETYDLLWAEAEVTGVVGRAIRINCRYDEQKYSGHRKYWCRGYYRSSCEDVIDTKAVNGQRGRFSITDKRDGVFTVTMENLTMRDAGWYNCGIDQRLLVHKPRLC